MKAFLKDTIVSLLIFEAKLLIKRRKPVIIAITGSVGKTTTKDAIYAAIKNHVPARKSEKSYNSDIGVPLTILGLPNAWSNPFLWAKNLFDGLLIALFQKEYPKVLVLETGIDRPGDMARLTEWLTPDIAVLTRLPAVPVHVEFFSSPEEVVNEKMKLVEALEADGVVVYNNDDTIIQKQLPTILQKVVGYGRYRKSDVTGSEDRIIYNDDIPVGVEFKVAQKDEESTVRVKGTVGTQQMYAGLAALSVASVLDIPLAEAAESLASLEPPAGRLKIVKGIKSTIIIDDTYNSSPIAVEQALQTLNELKYAKRKIVVLGDMLELGRYSSNEHERIGSMVPPIAKRLITVGVRARKFAEGALDAGMPEANILQYDQVRRAGRELQNLIEPGDVILIKASQGIRAERLVEEIMANPEEAGEVLVRQDKAWQQK